MGFDIDVPFIDENMKVIKKIEGLKPWKAIMPVSGAKIVIEAKAGTFRDIEAGNCII